MFDTGDYRQSSVLFVDDEEKICKYFQRLFAQDFPILTARNGAEALEVMERESDSIAVVLTDQRMPIRSGVSLLNEIRRRYPHVIRLLTTAFADLGDAIDAVNRGEVRRYITKPWDIKALRQDLHDAMETFVTQQYERDLLQEKRHVMLSLASYVAHEMRTPFVSIYAAANGIGRYLPTLLETYDQASREGLAVRPLRAEHRRALMNAVSNIERLVNRANAVIDILLINAGGKRIERSHFAQHSMRGCVEAALLDYPFTAGQRERVTLLDSPDFTFQGPDNLMIYVLFNLLKNALYALAAADHGEIEIWSEPDVHENRLHVRDTGSGIPPEVLSQIFDEFTSFRPPGMGTGLGLAFCKRVVTGLGGDIRCVSEEGRFADFIVRLPVVDEQSSPVV